MRGLLIGAAALALVACTTTQNADFHFKAEQVETNAELAYVGVATIMNALEASTPSKATQAEEIKTESWKALQAIRLAYAAGQAIDLTQFNAAAAKAQALQKGN
jgi:hypothetical protein